VSVVEGSSVAPVSVTVGAVSTVVIRLAVAVVGAVTAAITSAHGERNHPHHAAGHHLRVRVELDVEWGGLSKVLHLFPFLLNYLHSMVYFHYVNLTRRVICIYL
jgi:hypothetical protein